MNIALTPRYFPSLSYGQRMGDESQKTDTKNTETSTPTTPTTEKEPSELNPPSLIGNQFEKPEEYVSNTPHEEKTKTTLKAGTMAGLVGAVFAVGFIVGALFKSLFHK